MKKEYIKLTDMWNEGRYNELGDTMRTEEWSRSDVADFCNYFAKYVGLNELKVLSKFL